MTVAIDYKNYEPAQVDHIIRRFMSMPLQEIKQYQRADVPLADCFTEAIIDVEELDKKKTQYMDFLDIFCLIEHISENPAYETTRDDGSDCSAYLFKIFHYRMLMRYLLNANERAIPVKLFLALPVRAFYAYLENVACNKEMYNEFNLVKCCIREFMKDFDENTTTIKQVLDAVSKTLQKEWLPMSLSSDKYESMIMKTYELLGRFLIGSFKMAFKHRFNLEYVKEKYELNDEKID